MPDVLAVKPLDNRRVWLRFSDGTEGIADLSEFSGKGVFKAWDREGAFEKVRVGPGGEIQWADQIDLCPDALYLKVTGKTPEELFPSLRNVIQHAGN
jgi:Protein of unknown function (DUF2442)